MNQKLDALSQVYKHPHLLASEQVGLTWSTGMQPEEIFSDADPPGWPEREERWSIDNLLGLYNSQDRKITIFRKGISFVAQQWEMSADWIEYIVRIHEWSHAIFHVGIDGKGAEILAMAGLANDNRPQEQITAGLTNSYLAVNSFVHEQIAQATTWLALIALRDRANMEESKNACTSLGETFEKLTGRQPREYRLDDFRHLVPDRLRTRLRDMIPLIRNGGVRGDQGTWKTIMLWP